MANRIRGEIPIETPSGVMVLCYTINAIVELEDKTGQSFFKILADIEAGDFSIKTIRSFIWAGLKSRQPQITEEQAGEIISDIGMGEVLNKMQEAFVASFPEMKKEGGDSAGGNPPQKPGNGKTSTSPM